MTRPRKATSGLDAIFPVPSASVHPRSGRATTTGGEFQDASAAFAGDRHQRGCFQGLHIPSGDAVGAIEMPRFTASPERRFAWSRPTSVLLAKINGLLILQQCFTTAVELIVWKVDLFTEWDWHHDDWLAPHY
jgi:hypothetical protein